MDLKAFAAGEVVAIPGRGIGFTERPPRKPLISAVEGYALAGGTEVVLATDLVVASRSAKFGIPEVKRGLVAAGGGLLRLPRRIPYQKALELALTGESFTAEQGEQWGFVNAVTEPGEALAGRHRTGRAHHGQRPARGRDHQGDHHEVRGAGPKKRCGRSNSNTSCRSSPPTTRRRARSHSPRSAPPTGPAPEGDVVDLGLENATAVVVGGGRGMGLAAARCLADDGARVAVVGRTQTVLDEAVEDLSSRGSPDALGLVADVTDAEAAQRVFDEVGRRWDGELNILVNVAGPSAVGTFDDLTDDQWRQAVDEGVMGMVHCVRSALPLLRKAEWARIVNFSAHSTQRQSVILPAYTAAKAMVTSISKNLSLALAPDEIMVNVVSPGSIAVGVAGGLGRVGRRRRKRPLRGDGRHRQAFRAPGASATRRPARRDRSRRRVPGLAAQLLHDRRQHQRRRR